MTPGPTETAPHPEDLDEALFLDALRMGHRVHTVASGRSMLPWILPGSRLLIEPPPFASPPLSPGDLILARAGGCLRLHRLIEQRSDGAVILKGDSVLRRDPPVAREHLYGRVVAIEGRLWTRFPLGGLHRRAAALMARASRSLP